MHEGKLWSYQRQLLSASWVPFRQTRNLRMNLFANWNHTVLWTFKCMRPWNSFLGRIFPLYLAQVQEMMFYRVGAHEALKACYCYRLDKRLPKTLYNRMLKLLFSKSSVWSTNSRIMWKIQSLLWTDFLIESGHIMNWALPERSMRSLPTPHNYTRLQFGAWGGL